MHPSSFTTLLLWRPDFEGVSGNEFPISFLRLGPHRPLPPILIGGRDGCGLFISRAKPPARCEGFFEVPSMKKILFEALRRESAKLVHSDNFT